MDCRTRSQLSFALYRLPWTDECYFVLQASEKVETLKDIAELNGKEGFVIAPFQQTEEHPLVLIRPDITAYDWNEIRLAGLRADSAWIFPLFWQQSGACIRRVAPLSSGP